LPFYSPAGEDCVEAGAYYKGYEGNWDEQDDEEERQVDEVLDGWRRLQALPRYWREAWEGRDRAEQE
jgi:hypothetical protein